MFTARSCSVFADQVGGLQDKPLEGIVEAPRVGKSTRAEFRAGVKDRIFVLLPLGFYRLWVRVLHISVIF